MKFRFVKTLQNTKVKLQCIICEKPMFYIPLGQRHKLVAPRPVFYHEKCTTPGQELFIMNGSERVITKLLNTTSKDLRLVDDLQLWISEREGKIPIEVLYLPRPASDYPGCYPLHFEKHLPRLLETEKYVHFFGGKAISGYRIDTNKETNPSLIANVEELPKFLQDNSFEGGMADPPYNEDFARDLYDCPYPQWSKWTHELVRIVKPGGLIGIMNNYPVPRLAGCQWEKIVILLLRIKQFPKVITIQRKENNEK